jgi:RimJ/RimL family protein N-acetyltransferase
VGGLIRRLEREQPGAPGDRFQFAIAPKGADDLIGDCTLKVGRGYARQAEIDFTLSRAYQGKGYATEADDRARADKLRGTCDPLDKDPRSKNPPLG